MEIVIYGSLTGVLVASLNSVISRYSLTVCKKDNKMKLELKHLMPTILFCRLVVCYNLFPPTSKKCFTNNVLTCCVINSKVKRCINCFNSTTCKTLLFLLTEKEKFNELFVIRELNTS